MEEENIQTLKLGEAHENQESDSHQESPEPFRVFEQNEPDAQLMKLEEELEYGNNAANQPLHQISLSPKHQFNRRKRHRHRKDDGCGMKAILRLLLKNWAEPPMRVKHIASLVTQSMNINNQGYEYASKTIQKRIYDVCLVLKTIGLIKMDSKKKVCLLNINNKLCMRDILHISKEEDQRRREKKIQQKKIIVYKLKESLNLLRVFNRHRIYSQISEGGYKFHINGIVGVIMDPANIVMNGSSVLNFGGNSDKTVVLRSVSSVMSNLDLISKIF